MPLDPEVDLKTLPPEQMLKELTDRLREKVQDWEDYNDGGYYYSDEEAAAASAKERAFEQAADDLEWILRAFGLERK